MSSDSDSTRERTRDRNKNRKHKRRKHKKKHHRDKYDSDGYSSDDLDKKDRYKGRHEDDDDVSSHEVGMRDEDISGHRDRHKSKRKEKKLESSSSRRKRSRSKKRSHYSSSDDDERSTSGDRDRDRDRSKRRKHNKKHSSHRKEKRKNKRELETSSTSTPTSSAPKKYDALLSQLSSLLSNHPGLATEFPYMLIRMSSGSSINLSQVPDPSVANGFRDIFQTLGCTCTGTNGNDEWKFDDGGRIKYRSSSNSSSNDELVLIKLVRYLMDDKGFTMDAIHGFETGDHDGHAPDHAPVPVLDDHKTKQPAHGTGTDICSEISSLTTMLLDKFQSGEKDKKSSLAKELFGILQMIAEEEIVCLDAIPDETLRESVEKLFMIIGLSKEEMEEEEDDDDDDPNDDGKEGGNKSEDGIMSGQEATTEVATLVSFGYVLPEKADVQFDRVKMKLDAAVTACRATHQSYIQESSSKRTLGPSLPPPEASKAVSAFDLQDESDDDDEGPAPLGEMIQKKKRKGASLSSAALKKMVKDRDAQMIHATTGVDPNESANDGGREEWMMQPGEHDFLTGVLSKGIKNRTFKNEKGRAVDVEPDVPLDPKIQKQVDSIIKMHEEARGPSLIEQHRKQKAEKKMAEREAKGDWTWNREKDLDSGRRVDKNHLQMVMGGASKDLKNKFQGTYTKSFT